MIVSPNAETPLSGEHQTTEFFRFLDTVGGPFSPYPKPVYRISPERSIKLTRKKRLNKRRWWKIRKRVIHRDRYKCLMCKIKVDDKCYPSWDHAATVDHIVPLSQGGAPYDLDNLQTLCLKCHRRKSKVDDSPDYTPVTCIECRKEFSKKKWNFHLWKVHGVPVSRRVPYPIEGKDYVLGEDGRGVRLPLRSKLPE